MSTMDIAKKKKKAENDPIQQAETTNFYHRNLNKCHTKLEISNSTKSTKNFLPMK